MTIIGADKLLEKLEEMGIDVEQALEQSIAKTAQKVKADAKLMAPVDMSRLRNSITHKIEKSEGKIDGIVYTNVEYAAYQEFGTGQKGSLANIKRPDGISYKADWGGIPPQPYLYPALLNNKERAERDMVNALKDAIKKAVK